MIRQRLIATAILIALSATPLFATDFYVDVQNGSDAAAGTSPATAWKTLNFAASNAAVGNIHTIHVAPGTYSPASGELFPLQFRGQHLVGDQGANSTILDAGGATHIFEMFNSPPTPVPSSLTSLKGLTLQNGVGGVRIEYTWSGITISIEDIVIRNMFSYGISARSDTFSGSGANYHVTVVRSTIQNCGTGIATSGTSGPNSLDVVDCAITNNSIRGVDLSIRSTYSLRLERCRITGNALGGVQVAGFNFGFATAQVLDCLIADSTRGYVASSAFQSNIATTMRRCTIASNSNHGIAVDPAGGQLTPSFTLNGVLVYGNGIDYSSPIPPALSFSQIGGADPLFRDLATGDFRVFFGSPVIDTGDPATAVGTLDLNRVARSVDGDLDTLERADIGCHEFRTLDINTTGQQGTLLGLEIFGAAGNSSSMRLGRGAFGAPVATAFGEFDMNAIANFPWVTFPVAPGPGFLFQRTIPTAPIFIGQTYSFQGLVTSSASPSAAAWSNAVSFTIRP